jgi:peptidyl-prolyl cis-trans isomerase SurA
MKIIIYLIIVLLNIFSITLNAQNNLYVDRIIAKIGGEIILYSDLQDQKAYVKERQGAALNENDDCAILENLFLQKFMIHQAKLDSIEVRDEEVEQQLDARIDQILQYMNNDTKKFEEYYGQTIAQVRNRFREDLKNQLLTERLQNKVIGNVSVTPQETDVFFRRIPKDSLPYFSSEVEISEILHKPKPNSEAIKNAKEKLNKLLIRIKGGESFEKLAQTYSDDPGSAKAGGSLGWMKRGNLVPEYEAVAFNLEKDSVSGIVESEFGYHIIQLLGRRGNNINTRHILIKPEITEEDYKKSEKFLDSIRTLILKDSMPFELAVRQFSDKKSETYNNGGQLINPKTGNNYFEVADLEPDVYFAIDALKVGEISKPVGSNDQEGKKYFRIFKLQSRTNPHKASLEADYAKIQTAAKELKKNEHFKKWLDQKIPKIYAEVDPDLKSNCPNLQSWGGAHN